MMAGILKTHEMIKDFEASGFSKQQAEALTNWQTKIADETFVTKSDLHAESKDLEHRLTIKIYQAQIAGAILVVGIMKLIL